MHFELVSEIRESETFATGNAIRELPRLRKAYGQGRWRKRKGFATIKLPSGEICEADIHWYEATGLARFELKIKDILD